MNHNTITDQRGGGCPHCGQTNGYVNTRGGDHWGVCDQHKTRWYIGFNLFSSWQDETEEERTKSAELLSQYREVEAVMPEQYEAASSAEHR